MFASFAYASLSESGWDETVQSIYTGNNRRYLYNVEERTYETVRCLADYSMHNLLGRGTRIYLVVDKETGEECVLKDFWADATSRREKEIMDEILTDVSSLTEDYESVLIDRPYRSPLDIVKKHILTIEKDIYVKADDQFDDTVDVIMRGHIPDALVVEESQRAGSVLSLDHVGLRESIKAKRHCRIVYKEFGTPLYKLTKFSEVNSVLDDVTLGEPLITSYLTNHTFTPLSSILYTQGWLGAS